MGKPLTDLSREDIFKYFPLRKRKHLAKCIKELRKAQAKEPFRLVKVDFDNNVVSIDDLKWIFIFDGNLKMLADIPFESRPAFYQVHRLEMLNCNGKLHVFKDYQPFLRFLNYYLNRKASRIWNFCVFGANFKELPNFREVSIFAMQLEMKPGYFERWGRKFLEDVKNNQFSEVFVRNFEMNNQFADQVKDMKINSFIMYVIETSNDSITQLNFPKMQLMEGSVVTDEIAFLDNVQKFIDRNPDRDDVIYQNHSEDILEVEWQTFLRKAIVEMGGKHKFRGYEGYISIELPNGREVQIWCKVVSDYFILEAVFEKEKKPSVPRNQVSVRNMIFAIMNFYQLGITQMIHGLDRANDGNPRSKFAMNCFFLFINHHLQFLTFAGSFGFSRLALWALPKLPSRKWSFLTSTLFSLGVTWACFRGYKFDCRKAAVLDIALTNKI